MAEVFVDRVRGEVVIAVITIPLPAPGGPAPHCDATDPNRIIGTEAGETLIGTDLADLIVGAGGADTIIGEDGGDCLYGNAGRDVLRGKSGDDQLFGNAGRDNLNGDVGDDELRSPRIRLAIASSCCGADPPIQVDTVRMASWEIDLLRGSETPLRRERASRRRSR